MTGQPVHDRASQAFLDGWPESEWPLMRSRLERVSPRLDACLERLYGACEGFEDWRVALYRRIGRQGAQRPDDLKALDRRREAEPDWFVRARMVGYAAYVDRFGGTLRGVRERIPYLQSLGVGYLHLLPFLRSRAGENDGGFAVSRFDQVQPELGSMDDLRALAADLREAGISLCGDFVLNHVADDHPWAKAARAGDDTYRRWFHVLDDADDVQACEASLGQVFPQAAPGNFTFIEDVQGWVWTTFYPYQWDLNYAEPQVLAAMAGTMLDLANHGIEVFRLDSAPYLWKRKGTACINEPEVHHVLACLRAIVELAAPACLLKAEAITPTAKLVPYFGSDERRGHECHLAYQSSLMASAWASLAEGTATLVRQVLSSMPETPPSTGWLSYVRCHDDIVWGVLREDLEAIGEDYPRRMGAVARHIEGRAPGSFGHGAPFQYGEGQVLHGSNGMTASLLGLPQDSHASPSEAAMARLALMYGLAYWVGTVPVIYMGDELGQGNNVDPADAPRIDADGRWLQRPRLDHQRLRMAQAGQGVPAAVRGLFDTLRRARSLLPQAGACAPRVIDAGAPEVLALTRGEQEKAWFNFSDKPVRIHGLDPDARSVYGGLEGKGMLPPWGMHWSLGDERTGP